MIWCCASRRNPEQHPHMPGMTEGQQIRLLPFFYSVSTVFGKKPAMVPPAGGPLLSKTVSRISLLTAFQTHSLH